jgi:hypothetical protein
LGGKPGGRRNVMDDLKRVSVVDDIAVQAYITLRSAVSVLQRMYQDTADSIQKVIHETDYDAVTKAYLEGTMRTYVQVASDIGRLLNTKGGGEDDKV